MQRIAFAKTKSNVVAKKDGTFFQKSTAAVPVAITTAPTAKRIRNDEEEEEDSDEDENVHKEARTGV